jgi:hypothetical protein
MLDNTDHYLIVLVFALMQVKHFLVEYYYQHPQMTRGELAYGHWGGILHSFLHIVFTGFILLVAVRNIPHHVIWLIMMGEFIYHYHLDWLITNAFASYSKTVSDERRQSMRWLDGLDTVLHQLSYCVIVFTTLRYYMAGC